MAGNRRKRKGYAGKILLTLLVLLLAAITGLYVYGMRQVEGRFLPNTTVNGMDYSDMTPEEAEERFRSTYTGRTLQVLEMGGAAETISYDAIDYRFTTGSTFRELVDSQPYYKWPFAFFTAQEIVTTEGFEYSKEKLEDAVHALAAISGEGIQDPVDAHIERTKEGYALVDAVDGNRLDEEKVFSLIDAAVNAGDSEVNLEAENCYLKAAVYADDPGLVSQIDFINKYQNEVIKISMEGNTYVDLTKDTFLDWMTFDNNEITLNEEALTSYVYSLADQYDTYKKARQFVTTGGDIVSVGGGNYDTYGYVMNREQTRAAVRKALLSGVDQTIACTWDKYGKTRDQSGSDFGSTYVEISLDQQHLWYYKEGNLVVDTPVVTGTANEKRATPTMVTQILDKRTNHKMKGSYGSSFARFAMWLTEGGILIHDASWRDEYGGDIYLYDGSHGCVNTPLEAVTRIYEEITIGTPVIIYDRENRVPNPQNEEYSGTTDETDDGEIEDPEELEEFLGEMEVIPEDGMGVVEEDAPDNEQVGVWEDDETYDDGDEDVEFFDPEDTF
ncbi:MAG: peptidoglycan binding domain-containing protein [Lachnospiraceae bacterium]|nr:peptidoglycan binding domain-containing protein [Lachnospiraceae bacterium]